MDQDAAYRMIQGFARAGVSCHMQRTTEATWDVVIDDRRLSAPVIIRTVTAGREQWRRMQREGLIAA